ncbi:uncharacterized protein BO95DRAFT_432202 [Aspergillus brunneoviolaceus CBS 621.78]|uniref:Uncharacterized protein n=1 Tax=Aspergillus brunneoviolaceus CBS 621.78 TaxID=1450534 RepID=A0ACD1G8F9_9EURO|nr:hypothetical protein BO95DRAFT_432202 [Aspergillus brunneoviolaceus CBS 621.78]RAH45515.1 hypothetical protein BO95DRAFT_432202 [Aspergillus brunneoviolaceus CBS 621.78]
MSEELTRVDSAVAGLTITAKDEKPVQVTKDTKDTKHRRHSSTAEGVYNIKELGAYLILSTSPAQPTHSPTIRTEEKKIELTLPIETQRTGWKLNTSPSTVEDKDILKLYLVNPPVKKIDLHFPLGLEVTARNMKGVTIKDALDAIYKQFKKQSDDVLTDPYLKGFEWDKDECWTRLIVHQTKQGPPAQPSSKKSKKKKNEDA